MVNKNILFIESQQHRVLILFAILGTVINQAIIVMHYMRNIFYNAGAKFCRSTWTTENSLVCSSLRLALFTRSEFLK